MFLSVFPFEKANRGKVSSQKEVGFTLLSADRLISLAFLLPGAPCPAQALELQTSSPRVRLSWKAGLHGRAVSADPLRGCSRLLINLRSAADTADGALSE